MAWRRAVTRSRLPSSVRLTLLTHSEKGPSHWHDDDANEHAYPRAVLAERLGTEESTIRRHYRRAERDGFLVLHEQGARGRQTVFHYVTPNDPMVCPTCQPGPEFGRQLGGQKGGSAYSLSASLPDDRVASPSSTPTAGVPDRFLEFWNVYPRKVAIGAARRAWKQATEHTDPGVILAGLRRQGGDLADADARGFCQHPANWLTDERWADETDDPAPARDPNEPREWSLQARPYPKTDPFATN